MENVTILKNETILEEAVVPPQVAQHVGQSIAGLFIFIIIFAFQFSSKYLGVLRKMKGSTSAVDAQLRAEIKQLYKEASTLSQPSTFAQAAKLRRTAAAKEKELAKNQELQSKEISSSFDGYSKKLMILKILTYVVFAYWFWGSPVAAIPYQLVQPFGRFLSWRSGGYINDYVMVFRIWHKELEEKISFKSGRNCDNKI